LASHPIDRLWILPAADVDNILFAAIPVGPQREHYLIEYLSPVLLPDIDALLNSRRFPDQGFMRSLVVGDSDGSLPGAREEAAYVAGLLPAPTTLLGEDARIARVLQFLHHEEQGGSLIYFATHGISNPYDPMDGGYLVLSDGRLTGTEVKSLGRVYPFGGKLDGSLVIMSACQSALGKVFEGGTFNLSRAWYFAGATRVLMSLWNIDDCATAAIMKHFSRLMMSEREAPDRALRRALLGARDSNLHPQLWAGFALLEAPLGGDASAPFPISLRQRCCREQPDDRAAHPPGAHRS